MERTLDALAKCNHEGFVLEILVVDNGSTSALQEVHQSIADSYPLVQYHYLPTMGLSNARNYGMEQSKGSIVAYFDDDSIVHANWFEEAHRFFACCPDAGAIGGKIYLEGEKIILDQLKPHEKLMLSAFDLGDQIKELTYNNYPRGTNIAFRKLTLEQAKGFNTQLGRKGEQLLSYEEIELCYRLQKNGHFIYYVPKLEVTHIIKTNRISKKWFIKRAFWQGRSEAIFDYLHRSSAYRWQKCFSIIVEMIRWRSRPSEKGYLLQFAELLFPNNIAQ